MGEMIGNIAHQWRQPLSTISTAASGMKFQKEYGQLKDEDFEMSVGAILNSTKYLSRTIDDFRNFFSNNKELVEITAEEMIENSLGIINISLENNNIELNKDERVQHQQSD
jgi:signal transduction histidine kinase